MECFSFLPLEWLYLIFDHCDANTLICLKQLNKNFKEYVTDYLKFNKRKALLIKYNFIIIVKLKHVNDRHSEVISFKTLRCVLNCERYDIHLTEYKCRKIIDMFRDYYKDHDSHLKNKTFWDRIDPESLSYCMTHNSATPFLCYDRCFMIPTNRIIDISILYNSLSHVIQQL